MRCTMVSDFATLPLTAVTPDSSAYICEGAHVRVRMPSQQHYPTKAKRTGVTVTLLRALKAKRWRREFDY